MLRGGEDGAEASQLAPALGPHGRAQLSDLGSELAPRSRELLALEEPRASTCVCLLLRALLTRGFPASVSASFPPLSVRIACSALRKTKRGWKQTGVGRHGEDQLIMACLRLPPVP